MISDKDKMKLCEQLWNECEPSLRRICKNKLSNYPSEIDDVIADAYLALCNAIKNDYQIDDHKSWLYGTVSNLIKLKYTEINRRKITFIRFENIELELFYDIDFEEIKVTDDKIDEITEKIFNKLLDSEKTLVILIYRKNLKFKEIARILNTTENAIKQKHYRLKRKIKQLAKDELKNL